MGVHITAMGIVSAIGLSVAENLDSLLNSRSGIRPMQYLTSDLETLVGEVKYTNEALRDLLSVSAQQISRTSLLGLAAAKEAWGMNQLNPGLKTGLISATSVGGMDRTEIFYKDFLTTHSADFKMLSTHDSGNTTEKIATALGIKDYVNTLSTACSSGANALMLGARLILQGKLDRVLVGGTDALTHFTIGGFRSLMIYDQNWCKPFDEGRAGLNLGEGAAYLLLENEKSMAFSQNKTKCNLSGWANAADAYHQTASSPDGKGATLAISQAIQKSGLGLDEISYVNAHGTGTKNNDHSESVALQNVFGTAIPAFSSTKPFTGHTLAAAGAIEAVFSVLAIEHGLIYPNLNFEKPLEETKLTPVTVLTKQPVRAVLSNSFGFGGNNSSVIFSRHSD
jgi:3-oxoacyl-(acyl-carrier-protein) synthase